MGQERRRRVVQAPPGQGVVCLRSPRKFVAIFDADFQPDADFLRRTVPVLQADPAVASAACSCAAARRARRQKAAEKSKSRALAEAIAKRARS